MSPLYRISFNYGAPHEMYFVTDDPDSVLARIMPDDGMRAATVFVIEQVESLPKSTKLSFPHPLTFPAAGKVTGATAEPVESMPEISVEEANAEIREMRRANKGEGDA